MTTRFGASNPGIAKGSLTRVLQARKAAGVYHPPPAPAPTFTKKLVQVSAARKAAGVMPTPTHVQPGAMAAVSNVRQYAAAVNSGQIPPNSLSAPSAPSDPGSPPQDSGGYQNGAFPPDQGPPPSEDYYPQEDGGYPQDQSGPSSTEEQQIVQNNDGQAGATLDSPDAGNSDPRFVNEDDNFRRGVSDFDGERLNGLHAYMQQGRLCTLGVCDTAAGIVPVSHTVYVSKRIPDGPITIGADLHPAIQNALEHSADALERAAEQHKRELGAENLVLRTRAGDQVATAQIRFIGEEAARGNPGARLANEAIGRYINAHPYGSFAGERKRSTGKAVPLRPAAYRAAVRLANGPQLTHKRVRNMASMFGAEGDDQNVFMFAVINYMKGAQLKEIASQLGAWASKLIELGKGVGVARGIQMIRDPRIPISRVQPSVGWEMGE